MRSIQAVVNEAHGTIEAEYYSRTGRASMSPERLLRAMLMQAIYSVRSERQLMERLEFDLLFRLFVGLGIDDQGPPSDGRNAEANFRGETCSNATHASATDPDDVDLYRKGPGMEARLCLLGLNVKRRAI